MHEGRVIHIEDEGAFRRKLVRDLEGSVHRVVAEAADLDTAFSLLDQVKAGELGANVVALDGRLSDDSPELSDARKIVVRIEELGLDLQIIGLSGSAMKGAGIEVAIDVGKNAFVRGQVDMKQILDELPEPEQT
jgi:hypothetical protein